MTTINLYQNQEEMQKKLSAKTAGRGFFFSAGILVATLLAFAGLKAYVSTVTAQNEKLAAAAQEKNGSLAGLGDIRKVIDMQSRLGHIKNNLQVKGGAVSRLEMTQALDRLGADLNQETVVTAYEYDGAGKVALTFESGSYADVARQIMAFKSSEYFQNMDITSLSREEKAIACGVEMDMKQ